MNKDAERTAQEIAAQRKGRHSWKNAEFILKKLDVPEIFPEVIPYRKAFQNFFERTCNPNQTISFLM